MPQNIALTGRAYYLAMQERGYWDPDALGNAPPLGIRTGAEFPDLHSNRDFDFPVHQQQGGSSFDPRSGTLSSIHRRYPVPPGRG